MKISVTSCRILISVRGGEILAGRVCRVLNVKSQEKNPNLGYFQNIVDYTLVLQCGVYQGLQ
jgi:hypothetical protein